MLFILTKIMSAKVKDKICVEIYYTKFENKHTNKNKTKATTHIK